MWLYFLLHLLVLVGELFAVQDACRYQRYWVKPNDSDSCKCTSVSVNTTSTINDVTHQCTCATLNKYAKCLNNGTCKKNALMKDKCIILIFLPGIHTLTSNLYVSERESLMMIKEPECGGNVEIHLDNASITLNCIAQLTLADFSVINDNLEFQNNLILMNVPHTCAKKYSILRPSYIMHINNVNLSGSTLIYECNRCKGKVNLLNIWFDNSYANITTTNCPNLSMYIYSCHLFLSPSQTGILFNVLQLNSVLIDSLQTRDNSKLEKIKA